MARWIASAQRLGVLPPVRGMGEDANMSQARDVAQFFRTIPGLDKRAIGEWLSEPADRNPFNDLVLRAFTRSFDFAQPGCVAVEYFVMLGLAVRNFCAKHGVAGVFYFSDVAAYLTRSSVPFIKW